jgi:hypothetical protein
VLLREVLADAGLDLERYLCSGRDEEYCHCQFAAVDGENWMSGLLVSLRATVSSLLCFCRFGGLHSPRQGPGSER